MTFDKSKKAFLIIGTVLLPLATAGALFFGSTDLLKKSNADEYHTTLDENIQPTLDGAGEGTMLDNKNVTWEYHNAKSYASGHVSLDNGGYFGVSSDSSYGYTGISNITINFSSGSDGELWLLRSVDGVNWEEADLLKDLDDVTSTSATSTTANNYRYIRFFFDYDTSNNSIDIDSVQISYGCTGVSATEDVDSAHASNVIATTGLTVSSEYSDISPNSVGGEAVRFTKEGTGSTNLTIGFGRTYTLGEVAYSKIEFDVKTSNINYGRTISLMKDSTSIQSTANTNNTSSYVWTALGNDWYHAEISMTFFVSLISGYGEKDIPTKNIDKKEFNAIKINQGNCVVDNLRIGSSEGPLGNYNNTTYKPTVGEMFWLKTSWVGKLRSCTMTFDDDTMARQIPLTDPNLVNGSPFYLECLRSGIVTITATVKSGYDYHEETIVKTITIA